MARGVVEKRCDGCIHNDGDWWCEHFGRALRRGRRGGMSIESANGRCFNSTAHCVHSILEEKAMQTEREIELEAKLARINITVNNQSYSEHARLELICRATREFRPPAVEGT